MSDFTEENQINQYSLEQKDSPQVLNLTNKKKKNKILAAIALILLLAVGAISSFILLGQKQDTRNQASVAGGLVNIKLQKNVDCAIGQTCYIDVLVNTGSSNIDALQAKVIFDQNSINSIEGISFKPSENLSIRQLPPQSGVEVSVQGGLATEAGGVNDFQRQVATATAVEGRSAPATGEGGITFEENSKMMARPMLSLAKNEVTPSKEIMLAWTLSNANIPFNSNNSDFLLGRIEFVATKTFTSGNSTNNMILSLDQTVSKATLYRTGQDSLNTPSPLTIALNMETTTERIRCKSDDGCPTGQYCYYEPTPSGVQNFMANAYCKEKITKPGICNSDADCAKNEYCYQPPMPTCPEGAMCKMSLPVKSCKERPVTTTPAPTVFCQSSTDCKTGEVCSSTPAGGCPTITENGLTKMSACASRPYCKQAEGISCSSNQNCFDGYTCNLKSKLCEVKPTATPARISCKSDAACPTGQYCYQEPSPICADGKVCPTFKAVESYCKDVETKPGACRTDADCSKGQTCYQPPMPKCPEGKMCPQVMPASYCKESTIIVTKTPTPTPVVTVSVKPSATPTPMISCVVPSCKNGVLKMIAQPYNANRDYMAGATCPTYVCEQITSCQYNYSTWSECSYGVQARTVSSLDKNTCGAPILRQSCDKACSSDSNCAAGESCVRPTQTVQTPSIDGATNRISNMGYCSAATSMSSDLNGDGSVNVLDLSIVIKNLFTNNEKADINKDKTVDISDYSLVLKDMISKQVIAY